MKQKLPIFLVFALCISSLYGQYSWENLGPDNLGSPTRSLVFLADGTLLAGSEGGGLWQSKDEGVSWQKVESFQGNPNITSIAVEGNRIMVATGATEFSLSPYASLLGSGYNFSNSPEGYIGYTGLPGGGVYVSTDNGSSWSNDNASTQIPFGSGTLNFQGAFAGIQKIVTKGDRTLIATREGLFFSDSPTLAWLSFSVGSYANFLTETFYDVVFAGENTVFATTLDSVFISQDGGLSFRGIDDEAIYSGGRLSFQRTALAVSPSDPNTVYVAGNRNNGELNGIWRTTDNGTTWERYAQSGSPGFAPLGSTGREAFALAVFPENPDNVLVAGAAWYTFTQEKGWTQTAQHFFQNDDQFIPTNIHTVAFDPNDSQTLFIGTDRQIARSTDGGQTFSLKTKGYESGRTYSVASIGIVGREAVLAGTPDNGLIFNQNFTSDLPSQQGFNDIHPIDNSLVRTSSLYPGAVLTQNSDQGLLRSISSGEAFETFYGFPTSPGASGITDNVADTIVDRGSPTEEGSGLLDQGGVVRTPYVLDELIPDEDLAKGKDYLQSQLDHYIFFCSRSYVWLINDAFGNPDGLQPTWNRLTNQLASGDEFLTAITVSGDNTHTVYVGTSKGNVYRLANAHDIRNFDIASNVTQINILGSNLPEGRSVSALAVDPQNPNRLAVTYTAYGGGINTFPAFVWLAENINAPFFTPIQGILPNEPIHAAQFVVDPATNESVLFLGTESGLYSGRNIIFGFAEWTAEFDSSVGRVPVYDIFVRKYMAEITDEDTQDFILQKDNTVFVATHGRGLWSTSSVLSNRKGRDEFEDNLSHGPNQFYLYPNPSQGKSSIRFFVDETKELRLSLFTLSGERVWVEEKGTFEKDEEHKISLDAEKLARGMYILQAELYGNSGMVRKNFKWMITE